MYVYNNVQLILMFCVPSFLVPGFLINPPVFNVFIFILDLFEGILVFLFVFFKETYFCCS